MPGAAVFAQFLDRIDNQGVGRQAFLKRGQFTSLDHGRQHGRFLGLGIDRGRRGLFGCRRCRIIRRRRFCCRLAAAGDKAQGDNHDQNGQEKSS